MVSVAVPRQGLRRCKTPFPADTDLSCEHGLEGLGVLAGAMAAWLAVACVLSCVRARTRRAPKWKATWRIDAKAPAAACCLATRSERNQAQPAFSKARRRSRAGAPGSPPG